MSLFNPKSWFDRSPIIPVLRLAGVIGSRGGPFSSSLDLVSLAGLIEQAFETKRAVAIALQINSPGGSPVQSNLIYQRIRALAGEKQLPVFSFIEDVGASGGYWLSLAGDEIYADENSIAGSIGVIAAGFGFDKAIGRLGVERRVYTAGERKMMLDPFQSEKPDEIERLKVLQREIHDSFKNMVRQRRGERIAGHEDMLFTGEFWTGRRALELGLIDGIGDLRTVMREKFGKNIKLRLIEPRRGLLRGPKNAAAISSFLPDGQSPPLAGLSAEILATLEERALWSRYGL